MDHYRQVEKELGRLFRRLERRTTHLRDSPAAEADVAQEIQFLIGELQALQSRLPSHQEHPSTEYPPPADSGDALRETSQLIAPALREKPVLEKTAAGSQLAPARPVDPVAEAEARSAAFSKLGQRLSATRTAREAARIIVEVADELIGWDACLCNICSRGQSQFTSVLNVDTIGGRRCDVSPSNGQVKFSPVLKTVLEGKPLLILRSAPLPPVPEFGFGDKERSSASLMYVPIRDGREVIGVLSVQSYTFDAYTDADLETLQALADHCGGALERIRAEQNLRESEARKTAIVECALEAIFILDEGQRVLECNPAAERMLGLELSALQGQPLLQLIQPLPSQTGGLSLEQLIRGPSTEGFIEVIGRRTSGALFHAEVSAAEIPVQGTRLTAVYMRDITSRKRAEQVTAALYALSKDLSAAASPGDAARIIGGAADTLIGWDACFLNLYSEETDAVYPILNFDLVNGRRTEASAQAKRHGATGWARKVMQEGPLLILKEPPLTMTAGAVPFGDKSRPSASILAVPVHSGRRKIGLFSVQSYTCSAYTSEDLKLLQLLADHCGAALERIQAVDALHQSEAQHRLVWEKTCDGMVLTDSEGIVRAVNEAFCRLVERPRTFLEGKPFTAAFSEEHHDALWREHSDRLCKRILPSHEERDLKLWNGREAQLGMTYSLLETSGEPLLQLTVARDLSERKQCERGLAVRGRQQAALASLSQRALAGINIDQLMQETIQVVAETLDLEFCRVMELLPGGDRALLHAATGRADQEAGSRLVEFFSLSQDGFTARGEPSAALGELAPGTRSSALHPREPGVTSGLSVMIPGREKPWGVLGAHTNRRRQFTQDDIHFLQSVSNLLAEAIEDRHLVERLKVINEIQNSILAAHSPAEVARITLSRLLNLLPCEASVVFTFDYEAQLARSLASHGDAGAEAPDCRKLSLKEFNVSEMLRVGNDAWILMRLETILNLPAQSLRSLIVLPLISGSDLIGAVYLASRMADAFRCDHHEIAEELANHLSIAITNAELFEKVCESRERLQQLSMQMVEVQEAERREIARELHDEVGQTLTGLKMFLEIQSRQLPKGYRSKFDEPKKLVGDLLGQVQKLCLNLRPQMLEDLGLLPALQWHFERYTTQTDIQVEFKEAYFENRLEPEVERTAYRLVQEALTNVARHAGVKKVIVRLWTNHGLLGLQVEDAGAGFDPQVIWNRRCSTGLFGMRERVTLLSGFFSLQSGSGWGTRLTVELPFQKNAVPNQKSSSRTTKS